MIVFWIIGILFFVVELLCCVPEYVRLLRYHGRAIGTITKIEDNGQNAIAIFEYDVDGHHYTQKTQWTSNDVFIVGKTCDVIYNQKKHHLSYIKKSGQWIRCLVGTLFVIVGVIVLCLGFFFQSIL